MNFKGFSLLLTVGVYSGVKASRRLVEAIIRASVMTAA